MTSLPNLLAARGVAEMKHIQALRNLAVDTAIDALNRRIVVRGRKAVEELYEGLIEKHVA